MCGVEAEQTLTSLLPHWSIVYTRMTLPIYKRKSKWWNRECVVELTGRVRLRRHSFTCACSYMYDVSRIVVVIPGSGCLGVAWGRGLESHRALLSIRTRLKAFVSALHRFLSDHLHLYARNFVKIRQNTKWVHKWNNRLFWSNFQTFKWFMCA